MGGAGGDPLAAFMALDLSEEQRDRIGKLSDELRKQQWAIQGKVMDRESELRRLAEEQRRLTKALTDLQGQMARAAADTVQRARAVLTEEQRQRLEGPGSGPGSAPGMMPPGMQGGPWGGPSMPGRMMPGAPSLQRGPQGGPPMPRFPGSSRGGGIGSGGGMGF
jgi:hypothetical protein